MVQLTRLTPSIQYCDFSRHLKICFHSSIHPFIHPSIHPFIHSSIHPFIHSPIHPFIHSPIHPFNHSSIHPFTHSPIHPFIHSSIHPFIHSSICKNILNMTLRWKKPQKSFWDKMSKETSLQINFLWCQSSKTFFFAVDETADKLEHFSLMSFQSGAQLEQQTL